MGQETLDPSQVSATSHPPAAAARQTKPAGWTASAGQETLEPVHCSATSHGPAEARQTVPDDRNLSVGQLALLPLQVSATSHGPAAARHTAPEVPAGCWQVTLVPSHWSRVQGLVSAVQEVPADFLASVAQ